MFVYAIVHMEVNKMDVITMKKVIIGEKTLYNFYLFGVLVKNVVKDDYLRLYYSCREYCRANNIEITTKVRDDLIEKFAQNAKEKKDK